MGTGGATFDLENKFQRVVREGIRKSFFPRKTEMLKLTFTQWGKEKVLFLVG